ncbi:hypothetical protein JW930_02745 [Candidatus Woesearchaeota archaeon]|nr:hypothetical protein [Candidatus Woesearchaeota archaeon]
MKRLAVLIIIVSIAAITAIAEDYTCGDMICEKNENYLVCPQDCISGVKDNYCNNARDRVCDPDCYGGDPDCSTTYYIKEKWEMSNLLKTFLIIVSLLLISSAIYILYKKTMKKEKIFDTTNIESFSKLKPQKDKTWANLSEQEILEKIKQSEDFRRYKNE